MMEAGELGKLVFWPEVPRRDKGTGGCLEIVRLYSSMASRG